MAALPRFTDLTKVNQIQENFIAYFRIFADIPGVRFVEGPATWIVTEGGAPGTQVFKSAFSPDTVDRQIDDVINAMGQHTNAIDWMVFPTCQPASLGDRLAARGRAGGPDGRWALVGEIPSMAGNWMYVELHELPPPPPVSEHFHIVRVHDEMLLDQWCQISAAGFGSSDYSTFYQAYARHGFAAAGLAHHYIGYLDDQMVTSGTVLLAGGSASIYNVSTPVELRGQGFGSAITHALLIEIAQRGFTWSWIWASDLGQSVYAKLGFTPVDFGVREYQWQVRQ